MHVSPDYCKAVVECEGAHRQCSRAWTEDGFCHIHHPEAIKRRRAKRLAREAALWSARERDKARFAELRAIKERIITRVSHLVRCGDLKDDVLKAEIVELRKLDV